MSLVAGIGAIFVLGPLGIVIAAALVIGVALAMPRGRVRTVLLVAGVVAAVAVVLAAVALLPSGGLEAGGGSTTTTVP